MNTLDACGVISYKVNVTCPHCAGRLDLNQIPYNEEQENNDLGLAVFGTDITPAKWSDLDIKYLCSHCKKAFILTRLEY